MNIEEKRKKRDRRHRKVRGKVFGSAQKLRLCVFRSSKHIYAQLIDDEKGKTLASASDLDLKQKKLKKKSVSAKASKESKEKKLGKVAVACEVGKLIAKKAKDLKIEKIVFDRGGYKYHGRVKALADGARAEGLKF